MKTTRHAGGRPRRFASTVAINVKLEDTTYAELAAIAAASDSDHKTTMSDFVRAAVEEKLARIKESRAQ